jgi:hypothetical protein|tara:strand:- start:191 stop:577 length:387 start_codon:yes stop_codon:yes gene_type:complete
MAFKLGSKRNDNAPLSFKKDKDEIPGTPVLRKKLDGGILGEANNDGSIFVSDKLTPGSELEKHVLMHEMVHIKDMKLGKLSYSDDHIKWNGDIYPRKNGMINYNGVDMPEGSKEFPWEHMPWESKVNK